jgi:ClpP class serine protease
MSLTDLFWLFFLATALEPMLRQRILLLMRARKIAQLQARRGSRVITLVHRQETMRLLGFPLVRYIDIDDAEEVIRAIEETDSHTPIDIILHTPGGLVIASLQIAAALRRRKGRVTAFVPHLALSGGTLIALAADEIAMAPRSPNRRPSSCLHCPGCPRQARCGNRRQNADPRRSGREGHRPTAQGRRRAALPPYGAGAGS